jgi:hypothetical protein
MWPIDRCRFPALFEKLIVAFMARDFKALSLRVTGIWNQAQCCNTPTEKEEYDEEVLAGYGWSNSIRHGRAGVGC